MNQTPISIVHILWKGEVGGAERAVYQLIREQMKDPIIKPAIAFGQPGGFYWDKITELGCPVINLNLSSGFAFWQIPSIAAKFRPYPVHHFHSAEIIIMLGSLLCPKAWKVHTQRGGQKRYNLKKRIVHLLTGFLLRKSFNKISGNTYHAAKYAARLYKFPIDKIHVTYNPIDFNLLQPEHPKELILEKLNLQKYRTIIGTSANLKPWKRIDRLILSIAGIKNPTIGLLIVGDGIDRPHLEAMANQLGIHSQVVFAGRQNNIADYLQVMDMYCLPSGREESFGNGLVEAMAMSLPSIIFEDGGGMVEHIQNEVTGYIVKDQPELQSKLLYLSENLKVARSVGQNAAISVREKYNPKACAKEFRKLYPVYNP